MLIPIHQMPVELGFLLGKMPVSQTVNLTLLTMAPFLLYTLIMIKESML